MRIGLISGEYPPLQGGVGAYTRILGLALADAGHTVSVLAGPGALENDPRLTLDRVDGWGYGCWNAVATWARYRRLDVMDLQYQTAAYGMSAWIHFLPALARVAPWVVTFHDLRFPYLFPKAGPVRPWIVNRLARSADGVIATNPEDYAALRQLPHAALVPIGSNIPPSDENQDHATVRARYGIGPDEPLIVNFGLINRSKGLDELVEAVAALHSRDLAARALLVGSSGSSDPTNQAYEAELRARITAAGLNQAVVITGYLGEADVYTLLKAADVVALPFRDGASMRRGSLMAALAARLRRNYDYACRADARLHRRCSDAIDAARRCSGAGRCTGQCPAKDRVAKATAGRRNRPVPAVRMAGHRGVSGGVPAARGRGKPMIRHEKVILALIVAAYVLLGVVYSVVTPPFEASDELWHYPMVQVIAETGSLPVQDPAVPTLWRQEGSQPPLYYMLAAALTAAIDTSNLDVLRRVNPHADIGLVRPDGNVNMIVHRPGLEAFPWQGAMLAVQVSRLLSVALGAATVLVTWALGWRLFPERPEVRLGAAALNAFLPMFLFISGSVNNDNLSNLLGNLLTLEIVVLLAAKVQPVWWFYAIIGVTTGAGLLAKFNIGFLIPVVATALLVVSIRLRSARPLLLGGLISGSLTVLIAGWWYLRNAQLYGDPTGLNVFLDIVGRRAIPANAAQLWAERDSFLQAFWGFFGGVNVPLPSAVYAAFNTIAAVGLVGATVFIARALVRQEWPLARWLPALVTLFWPIISFASYLRWTAETPASQGRLLFAALSSILVWLALGLTWWWPPRMRGPAMTVIAGGFAVVAVLTPFFVIAPAYQPPALTDANRRVAVHVQRGRYPDVRAGRIAGEYGAGTAGRLRAGGHRLAG